MSDRTVDPLAVLLCQIPGMDAGVLLRLLDRWGSAGGIVQAPSSELRGAGLSPALVSRIVAAPRQRPATEAALKGLQRMGIHVLPLLDDEYPWRLRELPAPPMLLHLQGRWPPNAPVVGLVAAPDLDDERLAHIQALCAELAPLGATLLGGADDLSLLPAAPTVAVLPYGLLLARQRVPEVLRNSAVTGQSSLVSVAPVNAQSTPAFQTLAQHVVVALADGLVIAGSGQRDTLARPEVHQWHLPRHETTERRRRGRRGAITAETIARALGLQSNGSGAFQQDRLW